MILRFAFFRLSFFQFSHDVLAKAVDGARSGERHEIDVARLPGLETNRRSRWNIEPHAARFLAIELQRRVGFEKMVMGSDLNRPVAGVRDGERKALAAFVQLDLALFDEKFAGDHVEVLSYFGRSGAERGSPPCGAGKQSSYRLVHGDKLGAVRERGFYLNLGNHFGNAVH